jgi:rhodanese-related sulfurtransferase
MFGLSTTTTPLHARTTPTMSLRALPLLRTAVAGSAPRLCAPLLRVGGVPAMPVRSMSSTPMRALHCTPARFSASNTDTAWASKGAISYSELKKLTQAPPPDITLIDVREPDEVASGIIPSAVNVPLSRFAEAFNPMKGADFRRDFAFDRPQFGDKLIFYCRSGKRSQTALETAKKNGWVK